MAKQHLVSVFDLTDGAGRADFEELVAGGDRLLEQNDYPMGDGSVLRVVDHEHEDGRRPDFQYKPPVC